MRDIHSRERQQEDARRQQMRDLKRKVIDLEAEEEDILETSGNEQEDEGEGEDLTVVSKRQKEDKENSLDKETRKDLRTFRKERDTHRKKIESKHDEYNGIANMIKCVQILSKQIHHQHGHTDDHKKRSTMICRHFNHIKRIEKDYVIIETDAYLREEELCSDAIRGILGFSDDEWEPNDLDNSDEDDDMESDFE